MTRQVPSSLSYDVNNLSVRTKCLVGNRIYIAASKRRRDQPKPRAHSTCPLSLLCLHFNKRETEKSIDSFAHGPLLENSMGQCKGWWDIAKALAGTVNWSFSEKVARYHSWPAF